MAVGGRGIGLTLMPSILPRSLAEKPVNKPGQPRGGVGGAKEEDQGEHGRATHVPDTAPGKRVPEA
jgi:hypothetical protein